MGWHAFLPASRNDVSLTAQPQKKIRQESLRMVCEQYQGILCTAIWRAAANRHRNPSVKTAASRGEAVSAMGLEFPFNQWGEAQLVSFPAENVSASLKGPPPQSAPALQMPYLPSHLASWPLTMGDSTWGTSCRISSSATGLTALLNGRFQLGFFLLSLCLGVLKTLGKLCFSFLFL